MGLLCLYGRKQQKRQNLGTLSMKMHAQTRIVSYCRISSRQGHRQQLLYSDDNTTVDWLNAWCGVYQFGLDGVYQEHVLRS